MQVSGAGGEGRRWQATRTPPTPPPRLQPVLTWPLPDRLDGPQFTLVFVMKNTQVNFNTKRTGEIEVISVVFI